MLLDVADCEADQRELKKRRTARVPLVRWQLAMLQHAFVSRGIRAARQTRRILQLLQIHHHRQQPQRGGGGGKNSNLWTSASMDVEEEMEDGFERAEGVGITRMPARKEYVQPKLVGQVSRENELGRRKRYGVFLPVPGHNSAPTKASVWDQEDVSFVSSFGSGFYLLSFEFGVGIACGHS